MADFPIFPIGAPVESQLKDLLREKLLSPPGGQRTLPSALLWGDAMALRLFKDYSTLPEYYPTQDEIQLLQYWGAEIATHIEPGSVLLDLGCGDVYKIKPLLDSLEQAGVPVKYYGLDLSAESLADNLNKLKAAGYRHVECSGLCGTFNDAKTWAEAVINPIWYISLGSILGNDEFEVAVHDLRIWRDAMRPRDRMLIGIDGCQDEMRIWRSYNTPVPGKATLVRHALDISNTILQQTWYHPEDWEVVGVSGQQGSVCTHQWVIRALRDIHCAALDFHAEAGDEICTTKWFKWGPEGMRVQFDCAGLEEMACWKSPSGPFYQYLVRSGADPERLSVFHGPRGEVCPRQLQ